MEVADCHWVSDDAGHSVTTQTGEGWPGGGRAGRSCNKPGEGKDSCAERHGGGGFPGRLWGVRSAGPDDWLDGVAAPVALAGHAVRGAGPQWEMASWICNDSLSDD